MIFVKKTMMRCISVLIAAFYGLFLLVACTSNGQKNEKESAVSTAWQLTNELLKLPAEVDLNWEFSKDKGPVARVNDVLITRDLFNQEYDAIARRIDGSGIGMSPGQKAALTKNVVERLIDREIISQQAEELEIQLSNHEWQVQWIKYTRRLGVDKNPRNLAKKIGISVDTLKQRFEANVLRTMIFQRLAKGTKVTEADIHKFYQENLQYYTVPAQIRVRQILIAVKPNASREERAALKAKADELLKIIKRTEFAPVANKHSDGSNRQRGGDLGYVPQGTLPEKVEQVAWNLAKGAVTDVIQTPVGFQIFKKLDSKSARQIPLLKVRKEISNLLHHRQIDAQLTQWIDKSEIERMLGNTGQLGDGQLYSAGNHGIYIGGVNVRQ